MLSVKLKTDRIEDIDLSSLPEPTGYRLLVLMPKVEEKVGSIILANTTKDVTETVGITALVVKVGPLAYTDAARFGDECKPWCQPGDYVLLRSHAGTPITVGDREYRIVNDDTPEATVADPNSVKRKG